MTNAINEYSVIFPVTVVLIVYLSSSISLSEYFEGVPLGAEDFLLQKQSFTILF